MQEFIARENIKRLKQLLESCKDQRQRTTLEKLLADEEEHLIGLGAGGEMSHETRRRSR